jgi:hypothetical protein
MDPRAGLENVEKRKFLTLPGLELRPTRSQSLSRLVEWERVLHNVKHKNEREKEIHMQL